MKITRVNCIIDKAIGTRSRLIIPNNIILITCPIVEQRCNGLVIPRIVSTCVQRFSRAVTRRRKMREQVRNTVPDNICRFITHPGKSNARVAHKEREALSISSYCSSFSSWPTISPFPSPPYLRPREQEKKKEKEKDRAINILSPPLSSRTIVGPPSADHSSTDDISINPLRGEGDKVSLKARHSPWPVSRPVSGVSFECLAFRDRRIRVHKYPDKRPIGASWWILRSQQYESIGFIVLIFYFENDW